jgi:GNAT superfamily N-acetyltransferase
MTTEPPKKSNRRRKGPGSPRPAGALRPAGLSDLDLLVAHRRAMFQDIGGFTSVDLAAADPVYRRWIRGRLRSGRAHAVVAEAAGRTIASAVVWFREDQPRPSAPTLRVPYLMSVYVEPEFRGNGIATRLTETLVERSSSHGYPRVLLHASRFGRTVYARLGFERTWEMRLGRPHRSAASPVRGRDLRPPRKAQPAPRRRVARRGPARPRVSTRGRAKARRR